jgi:tRNA (adenine37-N6)-methyltransferase
LQFQIIGHATTCFKNKFGIPRQGGLVPSSYGTIILIPPFNQAEALRGLETFSHLIITFIAHKAQYSGALTVRPPRLGGNKRMGVFATRSPYRPNSICTSIVKIEAIKFEEGQISFSNHDLLDGTPILDIKPYIPLWDSIADAKNGWIENHGENKCEISFSMDLVITEDIKQLIIEILGQNPKPRHLINKNYYKMQINNLDIEFVYESKDKINVTKMTELIR